jgi:hypothetical protein
LNRIYPWVLLPLCGVGAVLALYAASGGDGGWFARDAHPYNTAARIEKAVTAELAGRSSEAEAALIEAFRHDRMYETRWALANFYFRTGQTPKFWEWARLAAEFGYGNLTPLFELCDRVDPTLVLDRVGAAALPDYLRYLVERRRTPAIAEPAIRLARTRNSAHTRPILTAVDQLIVAEDARAAVAVWNELSRSGLIPHAPLDPARGISLTNASMAQPLLAGFDWRISSNPGVSVAGNRIEIAARYDQFPIIGQTVVLEPGREYRLRCRYRIEGAAAVPGLRWRFGQNVSPPMDPRSGSFEWRVPAQSKPLQFLALDYQRERGFARMEAVITIDDLEFTMIQGDVQ